MLDVRNWYVCMIPVRTITKHDEMLYFYHWPYHTYFFTIQKQAIKGGAKSELKCLEFINFWLCSIFAHAVAPSAVNKKTSKAAEISPPIFIVGTHRGSVKGDGKVQ